MVAMMLLDEGARLPERDRDKKKAHQQSSKAMAGAA
jgi:hypothetical protein